MRNTLVGALVAATALIAAVQAQAGLKSETVEYRHQGVELRGYLVSDNAFTGVRPGVVVVHEWWGLNDYARERADRLAELGYVAFAVDMYGEGRVARHADEAGAWATQIRENVEVWQERALLGVDILRKDERVDPERIAAMGYCFGGATVMQMAYTGADLRGVVSFHGSLPPATEEQAARIRGKILVAHGNADPFVPRERIEAFQTALDGAGVDWQMNVHGGARHSFTNPDAGNHGMEALAYDERADRRSWRDMLRFFDEIFAVK